MSLGPLELAVLVFIGLLFFGPTKLPELGRAFGETIRGFKKAMSDTESKPTSPASAPPKKNETQQAETKHADTQKEKERV